jgi:hypothetical protein
MVVWFVLVLSLTSYFQSLPVTNATVIDNVLRNGYTECVVQVDGKTWTTYEAPCVHQKGDTVPVRIEEVNNRAEILGENNGHECKNEGLTWFLTLC